MVSVARMLDTQADTLRLCHGVPVAWHVRSDVGRVRSNNEDAWGARWLPDGSLLLVVCDGMGGHEAGEVASNLAVEVITGAVGRSLNPASPAPVSPQAALYEALIAANKAIVDESRTAGRRGMGTTAIVALIRGREVYAGMVGDSRLYHVRQGHILLRTVDHTRVQSLLERNEIRPEDVRDHPDAGMLTRALGHARMSNGQPLVPEVFAEAIHLEDGDAIVLSSDGMHDLIDDWEVAASIAGEAPERAAEALVDLALDRGGHDNCTVAMLTVGAHASVFDPRFGEPIGGVDPSVDVDMEGPTVDEPHARGERLVVQDTPPSRSEPTDRTLVIALAVAGILAVSAIAVVALALWAGGA